MNFPLFFLSLFILILAFGIQMWRTSHDAEGDTTKFLRKMDATKKRAKDLTR